MSCDVQPRRQGGIALLGVLWVLVLLTVIASALSLNVRSEVRLARNLIASAQARHAAEGGVFLALERLLARSAVPRPEYVAYQFAVGRASVRVEVSDEAGKIDLNTAPAELLAGLLRAAGVEHWKRADLVDAIQDWRDGDDVPRINGAEDDEYRAAGAPYGAKDGRFDTVDELKLVLGMAPQLFRELRPDLTVHSRQPGINPAAASRRALLAVPGAGPDTIDAYLELRARRVENGLAPPPALSIDARYRAGATARTFTIRSRARTHADIAAEVAAVVTVLGTGNPAFTVLSWESDAHQS